MRFSRLRRHWDRLGRRDPLWAALTHPDKTSGGWDREAFFRSGADEIAAVLARARQLGVMPSTRRALDFGCGAGRLTQALAATFDRVDGVDISETMLDAARAFDRQSGRVHYHLNAAPDLSLFPDATFSFVYSTLALQHMEPRYSRAYMTEMLRVAEPGGLVVFQVPSHRLAAARDADRRAAAGGRLPAAACRAELEVEVPPALVQAGSVLTLHVRVMNVSRHVWPSRPDALGRHQLNIANHWLYENGVLLQRDDGRAALPRDLPPGASADVVLYVHAPARNGHYEIEIDLVQENAGWFAERGGRTVRVPCEVVGGEPAVPPPPVPIEPTPEPIVLFRNRHPRVFNVLRVTGVRDAYWAGRRAVDAVKARRDSGILWLKAHAYEPVVPPLINWWNRLSFAPRMEMHPVPRGDVQAIVTAAGATIVDVEEELTEGGYVSCRYWIRQP
jgi:SAM-dependent methyltransferase